MNKKEGNQKYIMAFLILFVGIIVARYLIYKIRPGTFSIITFRLISPNEFILLIGCALLVITEKLKYFKINLVICAALFLTELIQLIGNSKIQYYHNAILAIPVVGSILLMIYPIKKLRENKTRI